MRKAMSVVINAPRHSPPNSTPIIRPTSELLTSKYSIYQKTRMIKNEKNITAYVFY